MQSISWCQQNINQEKIASVIKASVTLVIVEIETQTNQHFKISRTLTI